MDNEHSQAEVLKNLLPNKKLEKQPSVISSLFINSHLKFENQCSVPKWKPSKFLQIYYNFL